MPRVATPPPTPPKQQAKKKAEPKRDLIADALKKDDARKSEQKKTEANTPTPPKQPPQQQHKFDPRQVAALIDRRVPQRQEASNDAINDVASAGTPKGVAIEHRNAVNFITWAQRVLYASAS